MESPHERLPSDRLAPLDLGDVQPPGSADDTASASPTVVPWRRWAALGSALVVGLVVGVVGNEARNDTVESSVVDLVGGEVTSDVSAPGVATVRISISLLNAGPRPVEVTTVDVDGFAVPDEAEPPETVTADPDEWTDVPVVLAPDCQTRPDGSVRVTARAEGDERTVDLPMPPSGRGYLDLSWQSACDMPMIGGGILFIEDAQTASTTATSAHLDLPITNNNEQPVAILAVATDMPGFAVESAAGPLELEERGGLDVVPTTWTINDCEAVVQLREASISLTLVVGDEQFRTTEELGNTALVQLARLAERVCET